MRRSRARRRNSSWTISRPFSACCSRTIGFARLSNAISAGDTPLPDPDRAAERARTAGQGRVRPRLRSVPRRPGAVDAAGSRRSIPRHLQPVPASRRYRRRPLALLLQPCPERLARNARTYEITVSVPTPCPPPAGRVTPCPLSPAPGVPAPPLPAGAKIRRTSSDPGRALLTGFVGGAAPTDDWDKLDIPGLRGISNTAPYFHNNSATTLEDVVDHYIEFFKRVQANRAARRRAAIGVDRRRAFRSAACSGRARRVTRLLANAQVVVSNTHRISVSRSALWIRDGRCWA